MSTAGPIESITQKLAHAGDPIDELRVVGNDWRPIAPLALEAPLREEVLDAVCHGLSNYLDMKIVGREYL
jgi:hypothetical protein